MLDACRIRTLNADRSSFDSALACEPAAEAAPAKYTIVFSCSRTMAASDGPSGGHSPFATALLDPMHGIFADGVSLPTAVATVASTLPQAPVSIRLESIPAQFCINPRATQLHQHGEVRVGSGLGKRRREADAELRELLRKWKLVGEAEHLAELGGMTSIEELEQFEERDVEQLKLPVLQAKLFRKMLQHVTTLKTNGGGEKSPNVDISDLAAHQQQIDAKGVCTAVVGGQDLVMQGADTLSMFQLPQQDCAISQQVETLLKERDTLLKEAVVSQDRITELKQQVLDAAAQVLKLQNANRFKYINHTRVYQVGNQIKANEANTSSPVILPVPVIGVELYKTACIDVRHRYYKVEDFTLWSTMMHASLFGIWTEAMFERECLFQVNSRPYLVEIFQKWTPVDKFTQRAEQCFVQAARSRAREQAVSILHAMEHNSEQRRSAANKIKQAKTWLVIIQEISDKLPPGWKDRLQTSDHTQ